ncbi:High-affinity inorganic phosphate (Pi) transporter [Blumeria graminis f. sp. tritici 96224]|uniref:High-affinity inorganic phosphate (Pi) transporter n=1 Tax=Blumeria graminis f. sp. tritici 96224 TaxID=1268274 RepID=A0A656KK96_BLUGR|nr:High-affinity inorganic phosphate (Pi) transporter [Blumeria graminis f. sp. tritici 96224]
MKIFGLNLSPKESIENYPGILVPLSQAHRRSALEINDGTRRPSTIEKSSISDAEKGNAPRRSTQEIEKSEASTAIEDLRAEILAEVDDEQQGSAYELKSLVINKAIQDIGMGKYNWELFFFVA